MLILFSTQEIYYYCMGRISLKALLIIKISFTAGPGEPLGPGVPAGPGWPWLPTGPISPVSPSPPLSPFSPCGPELP